MPIINNVKPEIFDIIKQVLTSWQVLVITIITLLYIHIVSYASKKHHAVRRPMKTPKAKKKEEAPLLPSDDSSSSSNDELGLEEA